MSTQRQPLVGAIDEGTSSARFILFRANSFEVVASHQVHLGQIHPKEGWVEQDPYEILNAVTTCVDKTVEKFLDGGGHLEDIVAVGITNQRESTIVWDKETGKPLYNSIVWLDMRTSTTVDELLLQIPNKSKNKNYLKPLCGLPLSPYFSAVKLRWLHDNITEVRLAMENGRCLFGTVDSWIIWNLTEGVHVTDVSNASRTMLMNLDTLKWDKMLLNFFEVPETILPKICSSSEVYGTFKKGPLAGIPIAGCLGDQQSALVGQQCLNRGDIKSTYGTGCFMLYNTGNIKVDSSQGLITTVAYQLGRESQPVYAIEGSVAIAGAAVAWLRDNMQLIGDVSEAQRIAEEAVLDNNNVGEDEDTSEVYFVPAFSGLYAPYWAQDARGVICGITENTTSSHIVRATLEAVCFQTRDILDAMYKDSGIALQQLKVDGGMTANKLLMQLQSDICGVPVLCPKMAETTSLGVAMMAGYAVGVWNLSDILKIPTTMYTPQITEDECELRYSRWKMAVERALGWQI